MLICAGSVYSVASFVCSHPPWLFRNLARLVGWFLVQGGQDLFRSRRLLQLARKWHTLKHVATSVREALAAPLVIPFHRGRPSLGSNDATYWYVPSLVVVL